MAGCVHHTECVSDALAHAEAICLKSGARLTKTRRNILELLWQSHQPRKAYDLLAELSLKDSGAKPPTVYRALDFLQDLGLVHKVESLNAFIGCTGTHAHQYLICQNCGNVTDIHDNALSGVIRGKAGENGFKVTSSIIEIKGICQNCHIAQA